MKKYPREVQDFIAKSVKGTTTKELVVLTNTEFGTDFTESKMRSYKTNHKLKSGTPFGIPAGLPSIKYPENIKNFINEHYIGIGPTEMKELLNNTFGTDYTPEQIKCYYSNHDLNSGITGCFPKGHIPANKGVKGMGGWEPTQFKRGHVPVNHKPVGHERVNVEGYVEIKVAEPKKWRMKHQVIWEAANGPIPKGHIVIFGDGNKSNLDPNNLILISRQQLLILNRKNLIQNDTDLTKSAIIVADIYQQISKRKKKVKKKG